ncbi:hypothetical protein [Parasitella parasitica]|uniref:Helitron helicase-like domain-containing protein n=1 Tax=Parasitella parasitica TaxID=35722 RepID=A0A0B7NL49_9FUNG|nr:hypothetical protein [Parasitella parasitica]
MMHEANPFVRSFKTMRELAEEQLRGIPEIRMTLRAEITPDPRRYNTPIAAIIGVLIIGWDDAQGNEQTGNRDIVLRLRGPGNELTRINEIHQHYDPLHNVLMFPFGDPVWHCELIL